MIYTVKRHHIGDKPYAPGDEREAAPSDVQHLVANGVLVAKAPKAKTKAAKPLKNKAAK